MSKKYWKEFRIKHSDLFHRIGFLDQGDEVVCLGLVRDIYLLRPRIVDPRTITVVYSIDHGNEIITELSVCEVSRLHYHPSISATLRELQDCISMYCSRISSLGRLYGFDDSDVQILRESLQWFLDDLIPIMLRNNINPCFNQDFLVTYATLMQIS